MKNFSITPFIGCKWILTGTVVYSKYYEKNVYKYCISDGWHCDYPIVYDSGKVAYDFPEKLPKYVRKFIEKAIGF